MLDINCDGNGYDGYGDYDGDPEVVWRKGFEPPDSGDCDGADIATDNDADTNPHPFVDAWGNTWEPET